MPAIKRLSALAVTLVIGLLSLQTNVVGAVSSAGVGGRPANPDPNNPRTQSIFIFTANKSETKRDVVLVSNNSDRKQTIDLYAVDGIVTNTGAYTCSQQMEAKQQVGAWVELDKSNVTLEAGKSEEVGFSLNMPSTADVGEYNGCIVFEMHGDKGQAGGNVRILTRQAIRIVATVPGELHRNIEIAHFSISQKSGKQTYSLDLKNSGNVSADVDARVSLTSLFGGNVYRNGGGYPVLANKKLNLSFINESKPLFGGWYTAQAQVSYDKRAGSFGLGEGANLMTKSSDKQIIFVIPTLLGGAILLLIVCLVGATLTWWISRRNSRKNALLNAGSYIVQQDDTIDKIAERNDVSWKRLASLNRLPAPYTVNAGQVLLIPKADKPTKRQTEV